MWLQSVSKQNQKHSDAVVKCYQGENKLILLNAALTYCSLVSKTSPQGNSHLSTCVTSAVELVIWSCWCFQCSRFDRFSSCSLAVYENIMKKMWIYRGLKKSCPLLLNLCVAQMNSFAIDIISIDKFHSGLVGVFLICFLLWLFFLVLYWQAKIMIIWEE